MENLSETFEANAMEIQHSDENVNIFKRIWRSLAIAALAKSLFSLGSYIWDVASKMIYV